MRIAIMGAGSLGTIIGAYISAGGRDVELIDVNEAHVEALNREGATIEGTLNDNIPVKAITPAQMRGTYDLVLLLTKQVYNSSVLAGLLPYLHETSIVCSLQNGVPEDTVASYAGRARTIGGAVEFGATWVKPGVSKLTTAADVFRGNAFAIGELDGAITPRIREVQSILRDVGQTSLSDNLVGTKWTKLLINATMSGMSAALGCTYGEVLSDDVAVRSAARIVDETLKAGHAHGVRFVEMAGADFEDYELKGASDLSRAVAFLRAVFAPHALLKASMLQDLEKGRDTEIDYINGVVPQTARPYGLETPVNDLVVNLVKQAEQNRTVPQFAVNIKAFEALLQEHPGLAR